MSTCCRVCLQYVEEVEILDLSLICDEEAALTYSECFTVCTKIVLNINDGLPYNLCKSCGVELQMAYDFHKKVDESKKVLSQMLRPPIKIEASTSAAAASALLAASSFTVTEAAAATTETEKQQQQKMFEGNELNLMDQYADEDNMAMADDDMPMESYRESEEEAMKCGKNMDNLTKDVGDMKITFNKLVNLVERLTEDVIVIRQEIQRPKIQLDLLSESVYPDKPFETVEEFNAFENTLTNKEDLLSVTQKFANQTGKHSQDWIRCCWRSILPDTVAMNFSWNGTSTKKVAKTLGTLKAMKEAFKIKYSHEPLGVVDRTSKKFFNFAKDRLNKKATYMK